jgi:UDP-glucose 4-epimerase
MRYSRSGGITSWTGTVDEWFPHAFCHARCIKCDNQNLSAQKNDYQIRVLLTGATGTLGYNIFQQLRHTPQYLIFLPVRDAQKLSLFTGSNVCVLQADLSKHEDRAKVVHASQPDVIVHCAASGVRPDRPHWFEMTRFNVDATLGLFESSGPYKSHFVYISTGLVYRQQSRPVTEIDPVESLHPYGASKASADCLLRAAAAEFGRRLTLLRPFSFTGVHDGGNRLFPAILHAASTGARLDLSPGNQVRDFCAVSDIARGVRLAMEAPLTERAATYNLGSGCTLTIREVILDVVSQLGLDVDLNFGGREYQPNEPMHLIADIGKADAVLHWRPSTNLAYAVWELAQSVHPELPVVKPAEFADKSAVAAW